MPFLRSEEGGGKPHPFGGLAAPTGLTGALTDGVQFQFSSLLAKIFDGVEDSGKPFDGDEAPQKADSTSPLSSPRYARAAGRKSHRRHGELPRVTTHQADEFSAKRCCGNRGRPGGDRRCQEPSKWTRKSIQEVNPPGVGDHERGKFRHGADGSCNQPGWDEPVSHDGVVVAASQATISGVEHRRHGGNGQ